MQILYTKNMENCQAMEIINSLICKFISTVQQNNVSLKITTLIQNIISSLFFIPFTSIFHSSVQNDLLQAWTVGSMLQGFLYRVWSVCNGRTFSKISLKACEK